MITIINKNIGETPLEAIEKFRIEKEIDQNIPITYAGRLDPMADGLLIVLTGEDCKKKADFNGLDKEYEIEVVLGVQSDSYDVLGLVEKADLCEFDLQKFIGKFIQEYPRYSSKIIAMKELPEEMPTKEVEIYSIEKMGERFVSGKDLSKKAINKIGLVRGDFRQNEIIESWLKFTLVYGNLKFKILTLRIACSSGTYMRSLANNLGGLALSIKRTKIEGCEGLL
jgi:tRNA pseudouridine55 synthase